MVMLWIKLWSQLWKLKNPRWGSSSQGAMGRKVWLKEDHGGQHKDLVQCESRVQRGAAGCSCKPSGRQEGKWEDAGGDFKSELRSWTRSEEKDGKSEMERPSWGQSRVLTVLSSGLWEHSAMGSGNNGTSLRHPASCNLLPRTACRLWDVLSTTEAFGSDG